MRVGYEQSNIVQAFHLAQPEIRQSKQSCHLQNGKAKQRRRIRLDANKVGHQPSDMNLTKETKEALERAKEYLQIR